MKQYLIYSKIRPGMVAKLLMHLRRLDWEQALETRERIAEYKARGLSKTQAWTQFNVDTSGKHGITQEQFFNLYEQV